MEKYRVTLTADERNALEKLVSVGRAAARKLTHARILLLADTSQELEYRDDQIVLALGTSLRSVERIRKRFVTEGIDTAINPKPQPPRPDKIKIKGDIEQHLIRLACSDPPQGRCHWTLQLLADELVVLGLVDTQEAQNNMAIGIAALFSVFAALAAYALAPRSGMHRLGRSVPRRCGKR